MFPGKTAIVHEWLVNYAGSEKCVESFVNIWPEADVFALVDFLNESERKTILKGKCAKTSFIQHLPYAEKQHRKYLPLFPKAIESLNLSDFDLIISRRSNYQFIVEDDIIRILPDFNHN